MANKQCIKCQRSFPRTPRFFWLSSRTSDGFSPRCKACAPMKTGKTPKRPAGYKSYSRMFREAVRLGRFPVMDCPFTYEDVRSWAKETGSYSAERFIAEWKISSKSTTPSTPASAPEK
jgi:hypothetical protein